MNAEPCSSDSLWGMNGGTMILNSSPAASLKMPDPSALPGEIKRLAKEKNALILAHYYQEGEIQDLADFVGDSLELARYAKKAQVPIILFAGVHFMAEGAKILNPTAKVLIPDMKAGCSLSDSCPPKAFKAFKEAHPDHMVVSYINCSAAIKAMSDVICTSSNAVRIIERIPKDRKIIFAPDRNLGAYLEKKTGRKMVLWQGSCIVHETFSERKLAQLKVEHPRAKVIAHPECEESLLKEADFIGSTSALLRYSQNDQAQEFIVATEAGILHQMKKSSPQKSFIPLPPNQNCACNECPYMKLNTLEKVYLALRDESPELKMTEQEIAQALKPLELMLEWSA